ncbi:MULTISPECIES: hypothetical protein [Agrobacterium]|uniref:hypothetical protein n=1 Tax=Agrobacterium TaxID=357 RepID=UPI0009BA2BE8|nr:MULTISPECIES: hypothetical protein [Agrobacterium]QCL72162.1 hypothetical protein CFBP5499_01040 [Agrobacterium tumefaciens]CUX23476.1 conserved hypothetical protein [Agrobacterium sp. NCPPB 925]
MSAAASLFAVPLADRDRGFLRHVSQADGWREIRHGEMPSAVQCMRAGYVRLSNDKRQAIITSSGQTYLRQLRGVH